jgi:hypothetical protein
VWKAVKKSNKLNHGAHWYCWNWWENKLIYTSKRPPTKIGIGEDVLVITEQVWLFIFWSLIFKFSPWRSPGRAAPPPGRGQSRESVRYSRSTAPSWGQMVVKITFLTVVFALHKRRMFTAPYVFPLFILCNLSTVVLRPRASTTKLASSARTRIII